MKIENMLRTVEEELRCGMLPSNVVVMLTSNEDIKHAKDSRGRTPVWDVAQQCGGDIDK